MSPDCRSASLSVPRQEPKERILTTEIAADTEKKRGSSCASPQSVPSPCFSVFSVVQFPSGLLRIGIVAAAPRLSEPPPQHCRFVQGFLLQAHPFGAVLLQAALTQAVQRFAVQATGVGCSECGRFAASRVDDTGLLCKQGAGELLAIFRGVGQLLHVYGGGAASDRPLHGSAKLFVATEFSLEFGKLFLLIRNRAATSRQFFQSLIFRALA